MRRKKNSIILKPTKNYNKKIIILLLYNYPMIIKIKIISNVCIFTPLRLKLTQNILKPLPEI